VVLGPFFEGISSPSLLSGFTYYFFFPTQKDFWPPPQIFFPNVCFFFFFLCRVTPVSFLISFCLVWVSDGRFGSFSFPWLGFQIFFCSTLSPLIPDDLSLCSTRSSPLLRVRFVRFFLFGKWNSFHPRPFFPSGGNSLVPFSRLFCLERFSLMRSWRRVFLMGKSPFLSP